MKRFKALISLGLMIVIYTGALAPLGLPNNFKANAQRIRGQMPVSNMNNPQNENGLKFRLSEGAEGAENRTNTPPVKGEPLSDAETTGIYKRLPEIKVETGDQTDFAKRAGSLPPPKTGKIIEQKFPSDEQRNPPNVNANNSQTLEVVRFSPEGAVKLAPDLNVTFSQAMVALTSQEQAAQNAPVQISPALPEGQWRWLGTKTLMYDAKKRFPMATKFTARIPAGTKSATGQVLNKDVAWNFQTPPPTVEVMIPNGGLPTRRDALMFVSFDQEINPEAVLKTISVTAANKKIPTRLATQAEIDADKTISDYAKQSQPNRWLAFRAVNSDGTTENALPANSAISVTVEKGTPSAEGPLTTEKAQDFGFKTYGAMEFVKGFCCDYEENKKYSPYDNWNLQFTNQIDASNFTKEMVKIEPAVEGLKIYPSGNYIIIEGYKKGRTTYKVTVDNSLKDIFGQNLTNAAAATFNVGAAEPNLYAQGGTMVTLDPTAAKPSFSIYSTNYTTAKMKIYRVEPSDWQQFQEYYRRLNYDDKTQKPTIPGKLVADKIVQIQSKPDELVETRIDLSEYLDNNFGHLILDIEPPVRENQYDRTRIFKWVQSTQIGLDAFVDNQELVGFATDLRTAKPLAGVELSIYPNGARVQSSESRVQSQNTQTQTWTDWFYGLFASNEKPQGPNATDENGAAVDFETIEKAQTNQT
ncbi:MAG: Ig-like domain-containing protein, partial [Pyrinomonadaceae bacterium]